ncbi:hypothetical protein AMECASPLE_032054 [Ameca splendens]|uniref:Ig-like domain-containing protein n=1 Tax=Ameca splendens TaxID=208324 RepID=A0ABV0XJG1_9TELE
MAPALFALQCCALLVAAVLASRDKTANPGQDVTLSCQAPDVIKAFAVVKWIRTDLGTQHVLLYRENIVKDGQHPSFQNRVNLKDGLLKDGDVSLVLQNVTNEDNGTYECTVAQKDPFQWYRAICTIQLKVVPPGTKDGGNSAAGLAVGLSLGLIALVAGAAGGFLYYKKRNSSDQISNQRRSKKESKPLK